MKNLILVDHPLIKRDLTILRSRETPHDLFRLTLRRLSTLLAFAVTRDLALKESSIYTPLEKTRGYRLNESVVLVPVLRAGLGMVDGFVDLLPEAKVGHIGLFRDEETLTPVDYYFKVPKGLGRSLVILLDPMLATGGSAVAAIDYLKGRGAKKIRAVGIVAAPEGVKLLWKKHPDVPIFAAALDRQLNGKGYILPGLGDAGDRIFGTKE
ncbi:MAG: uracil phosphoribosyltransferase [Bacteroidota bacterium]